MVYAAARSFRPSERQPAKKVTVSELQNERNADQEIASPTAETEEADGEVLLLDDQGGKVGPRRGPRH
jgi:hypothetical protein